MNGHGLILAAGQASRMGRCKALLQLWGSQVADAGDDASSLIGVDSACAHIRETDCDASN